jgi:nucleotide-binding universal stress UspA family protein
MEIRKVLLPTDFSSCSRRAFAPVADLARHMAASIDLVNFMTPPARYAPAGFTDVKESQENLRRLHVRNLHLAASDPLFDDLPLTTHFLEGDGPKLVHELARRSSADVIALSSHGFSGLKRFVLGSFAEALLRTSTVPLLIFPCGGEEAGGAPMNFRPRRILFPYDFSPAAREALAPVNRLAAAYGATVLVVHAVRNTAPMLPIYGADGVTVDIDLVSRGGEFSRQIAEDLGAFAAKELAGVTHEERVVNGEPSSAILACAADERADIIGMTTHGCSGWKRIILGSVAEKVLRGAPCPIWIVPTVED